jgi:hypothetical protein
MERFHWRRLALAVLVFVLVAASAIADDHSSKEFALLCTSASHPRTAAGAPVTTQIDNLRLDATVKWLGPSTVGSLILYNGHGAVTGWGILVLPSTDPSANALSVLAGGIVVAPSPIVLPVGKWQRIRMDRVNQIVTVSVRGVDDDEPPQTYSFGGIGVNPVGGFFSSIEQTLVGDAFNGFVETARIQTLDASRTVIESWSFEHGTVSGRYELFGPTATGTKGHVLNLQNASWARRVRNRRDD